MALLLNAKLDIFVLLIGAVTLCFFFLKRHFSYWKRRGFKTAPRCSYIFGHFREVLLGQESLLAGITKLYKSSDDGYTGVYQLVKPKLFIRDPELIRSILIRDFSYFTDRELPCDVKREPLLANLFFLPGQQWKNLRAKLTPTFTSGKLKEMFPSLIQCGSVLQNHLDKLVEKKELLAVKDIAASHMINSIASVAFGIEVDTINDPNNPFRVCARTITQPTLSNIVSKMVLFLVPKLAKILRLRFDDPSVEHFIMSMVKQNLEYREKNNFVRKDFFQLLIQLRNNGSVEIDGETKTTTTTKGTVKQMTLSEMAAQVYIFFFAGFESSSSTICFCLYELAKNSDLQQRVHDEIDEVLARHDGQLTYQSILEMKFLETCIEETLRMYPTLPFLNRLCIKDYKIPGTENVIPKGIDMFIPSFQLQRDEKYYDEPNTFNPDRFNIESPAGKDQINRPFLSFGDGTRNCIGMRLGKMQTKIGLFMLLQKYKYALEDELKDRELVLDPNAMLLNPTSGLKLKVFKRLEIVQTN